jgi:hypothetical protein
VKAGPARVVESPAGFVLRSGQGCIGSGQGCIVRMILVLNNIWYYDILLHIILFDIITYYCILSDIIAYYLILHKFFLSIQAKRLASLIL